MASLGHNEFIESELLSNLYVTNILRMLPTPCIRYHDIWLALPRFDQNERGRYHHEEDLSVTAAWPAISRITGQACIGHAAPLPVPLLNAPRE